VGQYRDIAGSEAASAEPVSGPGATNVNPWVQFNVAFEIQLSQMSLEVYNADGTICGPESG